MRIRNKNKKVEHFFTGVNVLTSTVVTATFVLLYGFQEPRIFSVRTLHIIQVVAFFVFVFAKLPQEQGRP